MAGDTTRGRAKTNSFQNIYNLNKWKILPLLGGYSSEYKISYQRKRSVQQFR
jgi:hypothetical protein